MELTGPQKFALAIIIVVLILFVGLIIWTYSSSSVTIPTPNPATPVNVPTPAPMSTITTTPADGSSPPTSVTIPTPNPTTNVIVPTPSPATTITVTPSVVPIVPTPVGCLGANGQYSFLGSGGSLPYTSAGVTIGQCQGLKSSDGGHIMVQQSDGNLVIYNMNTGVATWGLDKLKVSFGANLPNQTIYQGDSNFCVYDANMKPLWCSMVAGTPTANLIMQTDGNLVIYKGANNTSPYWATSTNGM